jgi:Na+/proline symporter
MTASFGWLDWGAVGIYFAVIAVAGALLNRRVTADARDYFLAGGAVPAWLSAISVLATTQSAATFLGGPDYGYRGDFTYLSTCLGALLAVILVAHVFIPRFYAERVTTVYELLGRRFGAGATKAAGAMFLLGRILAGGARLYLAAIAVSMMIFADVTPGGVAVASLALIVAAFLFTFHAGLRAIVWLDLIQFITYVGAALAIGGLLLWRLHAPLATIVQHLAAAPGGHDKLRLFDLSLNPADPFALPAVLTGVFLLYVGNYALDQDTTQRLLACKDARAGARGLYMSIAATVPVVWLFIAIGSLLYLFYNGGVGQTAPAAKFHGENITVLMHFILTEVPPGLRGVMTVGVMATAVGTTMSALNAMASVLVEDFYRPWRTRRANPPEAHFVLAGRIGMGLVGLATLGMAVVSYYWQHSTGAALLEFVLSVMNFAYAGLLGVYFTAVFTGRGSAVSVYAALLVGFLAIVALQPVVATAIGLPHALRALSFPWQLCIGTAAAFVTCVAGSPGPIGRTAAAAEL